MQSPPVIDIQQLFRRYGRTEAVNGLSLAVQPGRCYGFFGRNGAGKTTTIKCLLNLLKPNSGKVKLFGVDASKDDVAVKQRIAYVPDQVAFYPWMTIRQTLGYLASFRKKWNVSLEENLLKRFDLKVSQKANDLSRGQKAQLALIAAVCCEPQLLVLDEPTSGLDPLVRREFIRTVIGAFQEEDPENRTIFISTHLISEFEGLIDEFTLVDQGKAILSAEADQARQCFQKIRVRFTGEPAKIAFPEMLTSERQGREMEFVVRENAEKIVDKLKHYSPESIIQESLSLEEIFLVSVERRGYEGATA